MAFTTGNIALFVVLCVLSAVTVVGNVISIVYFSKKLNISGSGDVFMLSLAVADLLVGTVSMPLTIVQEMLGGSFPLGLEVCKAWLLLDYTVCSASAFSIVLISHDRYLQIVKPHDHRTVTARNRLALLAAAWVLAFLVYGPAILVWDVVPDICEARYQYESKEYTFVMAVVEFFVPFSVMTFLYVQVYRHAIAWRRRRTLRPASSDVASRERRSQIIRKFNRRLTINLSVLLFAYVICWVPYISSTIAMTVCSSCDDSQVPVVVDWLLWSNSTINPFLYAFCSLRQRSAADLLPKCCRRNDEDSRVRRRSQVEPSGNERRMTL